MDTPPSSRMSTFGADLHDHAGGSGNLCARREFRPLGLAGVDGFSDGFSPYALGAKPIPGGGILMHSAARVANSALRAADAI